MRPLISIVMATYNASHLLRHAIASVRLQDRGDWELIVVSDACTDDTAAVVASFGDDRIRFIDLPENSGQQAKPNNVGVAAARGEYLAFLNQDDLYLPDHLSTSLACLEQTGADLICCSGALIPTEQADRIAAREIVARGCGFEPSGRFSPFIFHVASTWFLRRSTALAVGPWRLERDLWVLPSQDWLHRAQRHGARIHCTPRVSVIVIHSGARRDSYRRRESPEHEFVFAETVASDRLRPQMLGAANRCIAEETAATARRRRRQFRSARKLARYLLHATVAGLSAGVARLLGLHPKSFAMMQRWGGRGAFVAEIKAIAGSDPVLRED
jgi:glycosyltransferase involved in cell wall biosynthesis